MKLANTRKLSVMFILFAGVIISIAATKPSTIVTTKKSAADTGYFKNLKVLPKDISKDSLDEVMHHFTQALGVRCNFCHQFNNGKMDFASDEKPEKDIARNMMIMTKDINTKYFNFENSSMPDTISVVKCLTCHRQSPHPDEVQLDSSKMHNMPSPHDANGQMPPPNSNGQTTPPNN